MNNANMIYTKNYCNYLEKTETTISGILSCLCLGCFQKIRFGLTSIWLSLPKQKNFYHKSNCPYHDCNHFYKL